MLRKTLCGDEIMDIIKKHLLSEGLEVVSVIDNECLDMEDSLDLEVIIVKPTFIHPEHHSVMYGNPTTTSRMLPDCNLNPQGLTR